MRHFANLANLTNVTIPPMRTLQQARPAGVTAPVASPKLRQAAAQFESSFMQELLKPFKQDPLFADDKSSNGEIGGSLGTIDGLGTQAMADALAKAGGLGIAKHILEEMAPIEAAQNAAVTGAQMASDTEKSAAAASSGGIAIGMQKIRLGTDAVDENFSNAQY